MDISATLNSASEQLIGDENLQSHQQKSHLTNNKSTNWTTNSHVNHNNNSATANKAINANCDNGDHGCLFPPLELAKQQRMANCTFGNLENENIEAIVTDTLNSLLAKLFAEDVKNDNIRTCSLTPSQSRVIDDVLTISISNDETSRIVILQDDELDDSREEKTKEMVTLRNLEISPPPPTCVLETETDAKTDTDVPDKDADTVARSSRRKRLSAPESSTDQNESAESTGGRSKRQRTQTKLFQVGESGASEEMTQSTPSSAKTKSNKPNASSRKKSTESKDSALSSQESTEPRINDPQDVIFYEKNDYLAIRNEENSFYLCQLTENVRIQRPLIRIKWLDTNNGGQTYFLTSHYDKVPQKSIIMPVSLNRVKSEKKGEQLFTLDDPDRDTVMERLKRSLIATTEVASSQESVTER